MPESNVVFVSPFSSEAASTRRMIKLSEQVAGRTLIMPGEDRYGKSRKMAQARPIGVPKKNVLEYLWLCYNTIRGIRPTVIYFLKPNPYSFIPSLACKLLYKTRLVFDCDEWDPYTLRDNKSLFIKTWLTDILAYIAVRLSDRIIISNRKIRELIPEKHWNKMVYIPNGADTSFFKPRETEKKNSFVIGYIGSMYKMAQIQPILDSIDEILKEMPNAQFVFVGPGNMEGLKKYERPEVKFYGHKPFEEIPEIMSKADVLLATFPKMRSIEYASNMKLFEYMASQKPIVAFDVGEIKSILENGNAGYVIKNKTELKGALIEIYSNYNKALEKAKRAREIAIREYDWSILSRRLKKVVNELIA
jgi:glycosyltransferase involved in cell wall biosynthesis